MIISNSTNNETPEINKQYLLFARYMRSKHDLNIRLNRQLLSDAGAPPLVYDGEMATLMVHDEPFFMARELYGIDPNFAISLNKDMVMDLYRKYPNFTFFSRVNWKAQERTFKGRTISVDSHKEIYRISMSRIKKLMMRGNPEHVRKTKLGECVSFVFNVQDFDKI